MSGHVEKNHKYSMMTAILFVLRRQNAALVLLPPSNRIDREKSAVESDRSREIRRRIGSIERNPPSNRIDREKSAVESDRSREIRRRIGSIERNPPSNRIDREKSAVESDRSREIHRRIGFQLRSLFNESQRGSPLQIRYKGGSGPDTSTC